MKIFIRKSDGTRTQVAETIGSISVELSDGVSFSVRESRDNPGIDIHESNGGAIVVLPVASNFITVLPHYSGGKHD